MPYDLSYSEGGFLARFKGQVPIDELNGANGQIHGHPEFDNHTFQIVDLLDADLASVKYEDTELPAQMDKIASETRWGVKVALVVAESHALNIVNGYVQHARRLIPRWKFGVFSKRADAIRWVHSGDSQFESS